MAVGHEAVPVPLDQGGKCLEQPKPLPLALLVPPGEEPGRSLFPAIDQELPECLLEQRGGSQPHVSPKPL